jgi:hypothetical protein
MVKRRDFRPFSNYLIKNINNKLIIKKFIQHSIIKKYTINKNNITISNLKKKQPIINKNQL